MMSAGAPLPSVNIATLSPLSIGPEMSFAVVGTGGSAVWPSANRALFFPFYLGARMTATKIAWINGAAVSGNCDAGIYDLAGTRLVSSGSTAQAGTSAIQTVDITDTILSPGTYYMALAVDNTTAAFMRVGPNALLLAGAGVAQMATAFPLPDPATLAVVAAAYLPYMGVSFRTVTGSP